MPTHFRRLPSFFDLTKAPKQFLFALNGLKAYFPPFCQLYNHCNRVFHFRVKFLCYPTWKKPEISFKCDLYLYNQTAQKSVFTDKLRRGLKETGFVFFPLSDIVSISAQPTHSHPLVSKLINSSFDCSYSFTLNSTPLDCLAGLRIGNIPMSLGFPLLLYSPIMFSTLLSLLLKILFYFKNDK